MGLNKDLLFFGSKQFSSSKLIQCLFLSRKPLDEKHSTENIIFDEKQTTDKFENQIRKNKITFFDNL